MVYTNGAQDMDGLLEAHGNHVVHLSHKETENWPTAAQGAQLGAGSPFGTREPKAGPECHQPPAGAVLGRRTRGQQAPPAFWPIQISTQDEKAQSGGF